MCIRDSCTYPVYLVTGSNREKTIEQVGLDLYNRSLKEMRTYFGVNLERIICELHGQPCFQLEDVTPNKKQIISSKSFKNELLQNNNIEIISAN